MSVAISARQRVLGVSESDASDPLSGTVIGRMRLAWSPKMSGPGAISESQYQAAQQYIRDVRAYRVAIEAPRSTKAASYDGASGRGVPVDPEWAQSAVMRYGRVRKAVMECQANIQGGPDLIEVLDVFLIQDKHIYNLEGDLRVALNALQKYYGVWCPSKG